MEELKKERERQEEKERRENEIKNRMLLEELQKKTAVEQNESVTAQQFSLDDIIEQQKAASKQEKAQKQKELRQK